MASRHTVRATGTLGEAAHCFHALAGDRAGLLRRAGQGNAAAFEEIAAGYHRAILALLLALTSSERVALDLCHATLMAAYRRLPRRRGDDSMYIWFYRLAATEWLAWASDPRQGGGTPDLPAVGTCGSLQGGGAPHLPAVGTCGSLQGGGAPHLPAVGRCGSFRKQSGECPTPAAGSAPAGGLGELSARERLVFALKTNQQMTLRTVAQILGVSEEIAGRIFTRAVSKLRLSLSSYHAHL